MELKELMGRILQSDASEALGRFVTRQLALAHLAPASADAVVAGIELGDSDPPAPRG